MRPLTALNDGLDDVFSDIEANSGFDSSGGEGSINSDPSDGECDLEPFLQDPDC